MALEKRSFLGNWIAALLCALLWLVMPAATAQTVSNTASASWNSGGRDFTALSNTVAFAVEANPARLETFVPVSAAGVPLSFAASQCGGAAVALPGGPSAAVTPASGLKPGEALYIRLTDPLANRNPAAIDSVVAILTTPRGDREEVTVFETAPDSGIFAGAVPTGAVPLRPLAGDCRLSVRTGDTIAIGFTQSGAILPDVSGAISILADPYGILFDSEDGTPVSGVRISMVDAQTGAPARVFADDGVTPYPSTMITGEPVTDGGGNIYAMSPGEYRFPLAPLGSYKLIVEPPGPYTAPSTRTVAQLAGLTRPDGGPLRLVDASFGGTVTLVDTTAIRVDVPLDAPVHTATIAKSVSRAQAVPGDVVFYTVTVRNNDTLHARRELKVLDLPSRWLRLRPDSVRIDGVRPAAGDVTIAADGSQLRVVLDRIAAGASRRITYAVTIRPDAPPGEALNRAEVTDITGNTSATSAVVRIRRDAVSSTVTLIGRVVSGGCTIAEEPRGIAGVRVLLEDGSFAITDKDGRYHFEGLIPGTHVVQVQEPTLPEGGHFVDCNRSTRSAGSAISRFVTGQGGMLAVADFHADLPEGVHAAVREERPVAADPAAAGAETDWLGMGDGPIEWLFPQVDHNPRAPAVRVVIRHKPGQKVELRNDGKPVDPLSFDGSRVSPAGTHAISIWRGIPIEGEVARLAAIVRNADGSVAAELQRDVHFVSAAAQVRLLPEESRLTADGATRPVIAVKVLDRNGRPVHKGISGQFTVNSPYESAQVLDAMQSRVLAGLNKAAPEWTVTGDDGMAYIELAPTMVSGAVRLEFSFADKDVQRRQTVEGWMVPGAQKWTLVGLAEGSVGARSVADNMERTGNFDSDLGDDARIAFYAKGRILGRYLLTMAYDSGKQRDEHVLLGAIDPNTYYTVFADGADRRFDAASRNKLYVRIESATFYALFGDFETGFDQTQLMRYQRTTTGVKAEARLGQFHAQGFAANVATSHRRDEIQGGGISGPYRLSSRAILANSEQVQIEVRDRLRSEVIVERRQLSRFIDYDIDLLAGTITFKQPVLSRDPDFNPQFIVIDYEVDSLAGGHLNGGVRADWTTADGKVRIGGSFVSDRGENERTNMAGLDLKAKLGEGTELRAEVAASRNAGATNTAWLIEAEHHDGQFDVLAYLRSADRDFGVGQMNGAERGRRKVGVDARYSLSDSWSVTGSGWYDDSLGDASHRRALQLRSDYRSGNTDARLAISNLDDTLRDGTRAASTLLEAGVTQRLFDSRLELDASTSFALGRTGSIDLPKRHRLAARYALTSNVKVIGSYEIAEGDAVSARMGQVGLEASPWRGAKLVSGLGQQDFGEQGRRAFAAFGLSQTLEVTKRLTVDVSVDSSKTLGKFDASRITNLDHPVSSGGFLGEAGTLTEDFAAVTLGGTYRAGRWSATVRGELRNGQYEDRRGVTFGAIRQIGEGSMVGAGFSWTRATTPGGAMTQVIDAAISAAHRPARSAFAFLTKLEYRADKVRGCRGGRGRPGWQNRLADRWRCGFAPPHWFVLRQLVTLWPQRQCDHRTARRSGAVCGHAL